MCETTRLLKELKEDPVCLCHSVNSDLIEVPSENEFSCSLHKENLKCLKSSKQLIIYSEKGCMKGIELNRVSDSDGSTFNDLQLSPNSIPIQGCSTYVEDNSHINLSDNFPEQNIERNANFIYNPFYNVDSIDSSIESPQFPQSCAHYNVTRPVKPSKPMNRRGQRKSLKKQSKKSLVKSLSNLQRDNKHSVPCTVLEQQSYTQVSVEEVHVAQSKSGMQRPRRNITKKSASEMLMLRRKIKKKIMQSTSIEYQAENINQGQYSSSIGTKISVHRKQNTSIRGKSSKNNKNAENKKVQRRIQNTTVEKGISRKIKGKAVVKTRIENFSSGSSEPEKYGPKLLPPGWDLLITRRKSGKSAGMVDVYFFTPDGKKLRSRVEMATYLMKNGLPFTVDEFCFRKSAYKNMITYNRV